MKRHTPDPWPYPRHPQGPNDNIFGGHPHFERHIFLYRDQLLLDIDMIVAVIAKVRKKPDGTDDDTLNNASQQYRPMFNRWIDKYVNLAKGRMAAFILEKFRTSKADNLKVENEIDIELQVPFYWDDTTFQPLVQAVHDYVVNGAAYEFLSLVLPPKEHIINTKRIDMEQSYADIKRYICSTKPGSVKKPLQPF